MENYHSATNAIIADYFFQDIPEDLEKILTAAPKYAIEIVPPPAS
jgi:hypothetical protein